MKKILFCINALQGGGAERVVLTLAREMQKRGHYVHFIILDDIIEHQLDFEFTIDILHYSKWSNNVKKMKAMILEIENVHGSFDLILSSLPRTDKLLAKIQHPKLFFIIHTTFSKAYIEGKSLVKRYRRLWRYRSRYKNKNIIAVSKGAEEDFIKNMGIKPKTIKTIYNPFNFEEIVRKSNEENYLSNEKYIISVANFGRVKRHDILLKAYREANLSEKLVLVGTNLQSNLSYLVEELELQDKVIFMGFIANPYPLIKGAKLLVLSSDFEGLPTVLIESLILGTEVISTNCKSGPREILVQRLKSNLVPVNNVLALAKKMIEVTSKDHTKEKNYLDLLQKFSVDKVLDEYLNL